MQLAPVNVQGVLIEEVAHLKILDRMPGGG
jgi:hypothetical protein